METIFEHAGDIPITENHLKQLHTTHNHCSHNEKALRHARRMASYTKNLDNRTSVKPFGAQIGLWSLETRTLLTMKP